MKKERQSELEDALEAFEAGALDKIIARRRPEDFKALRRLISPSENVNPDHRQRAIYALGRWGDTSVVPDIVELMPGLSESHCITAIEALGRLGTETACEAVESYVSHPSPQVRKFVVKALERMDFPTAEAELRKIAAGDEQEWVRNLAKKHLERRRTKKEG